MGEYIESITRQIIDAFIEESEIQFLYYSDWIQIVREKEYSERQICEYRCSILGTVKDFIDNLDKRDCNYELKIINKFTELFLNTCCPRCGFVFLDWEGCTDFTCPNKKCKSIFCGFCLSFATFSASHINIHRLGCRAYGWRTRFDECFQQFVTNKQTSVRFLWLKDAINYIGIHNGINIILELYKNSRGTLMEDLIWDKYGYILMGF